VLLDSEAVQRTRILRRQQPALRDDRLEEVLFARGYSRFERRDRYVLISLEDVPRVVTDVGIRAEGDLPDDLCRVVHADRLGQCHGLRRPEKWLAGRQRRNT
jgi:hypothetical protein